MKKTIAEVLKRYKDRQVNLASEATINLLAAEIEAALLSRKTDYPTQIENENFIKTIKEIK